MRSTLLVVLVSLSTLFLSVQPGYSVGTKPEDVRKFLERHLPEKQLYVPGDIIVKMKPDFRPQATTLSGLGVETLEQLTSGGELIYRIAPTLARSMAADQLLDKTLAVVKEMSEWENVIYAQPNYILQITDTIPNDARYLEQWHYFNNGSGVGEAPGGINLPKVWDMTKGSAQVVVAVIDTGILPTHEDIAGSPNFAGGYDMITDPSRANDGGGRDNDPTDAGDAIAPGECYPGSPPDTDSWHGTHVAGTVGIGRTNNSLGVAGMNWDVKVQAVRVLGKCGGTTADINDGIRWAAGLSVPGVPANATRAKVINMSLGGRGSCSLSPSTQSAIDDAVNAGVTVVVAAGNEASDASGFFPASCNNVIAVAASDYRGHLVTRYSNFGTTVDIMAPGGDLARDDNGDGQDDGVLSTVQGGYAWYNGTSMAAPHVAGAAALLLAQDPTLSPSQLLARLQSDALPRSSTQCPRPCGVGLLQVAAGPPGPQPPQPPSPPTPTPPPPSPPPDTPDLSLFGVGLLVLCMVIFVLVRRRPA